jgi:hypothetical protein
MHKAPGEYFTLQIILDFGVNLFRRFASFPIHLSSMQATVYLLRGNACSHHVAVELCPQQVSTIGSPFLAVPRIARGRIAPEP